MPRARSPARDKAKELWLKSNKQRSLKDIAAELNVSDTQVRKWKKQDEWEPKTKGNDLKGTLPKGKSNVTIPEEMATVLEDDGQLTDKEVLFCLEYVGCYNATQSYLRVNNCTYNTARTEGPKLLAKPCVQQKIKDLKMLQRSEVLVESQDILQKQVDIACASITDYVCFGGEKNGDNPPNSYVYLKDSDKVDGSLITEVKEGREGVSIKLMDKKQAFDFLFKHFDMLNEGERKRLQTEKLKVDIEKANAELEASKGPKEGSDVKDWKQAVIEAANKRKAKEDG